MTVENTVTRRAFLASTPAAVVAAAHTGEFPSEKPPTAYRRAGKPNNPLQERVAVLLWALRDAAGEWLETIDEDEVDDEGYSECHVQTAYALRHTAQLNGSLVEGDLRCFVNFEAKGKQLAAQLLKGLRPA